MGRYFIGLDCGGSRTKGMLADESLNVLARASAGPGNPLSAGLDRARKSYESTIRRLLRRACVLPTEVDAAVVGAAGAGRPADARVIQRAVREFLPRADIRVETDGMIALLGGTLGEPGVIVIAGTGSFVLGIDRRGRRRRGGGWGPLLGDEGSGATLGREAVQAVLRAEDGRTGPTRLKSAVLSHFRVGTVEELVTRIYRRPPTPRDYARLWPAVCELASDRDRAARALSRRGGEELAETALSVLRGLDFGRSRIPVILSGGVLSAPSLLRSTLVKQLKNGDPRVRIEEPAAPPEMGAILIAAGSVRLDETPRRG
jgi:N-acetylglucosamine kinase-like BadF-type ATPase